METFRRPPRRASGRAALLCAGALWLSGLAGCAHRPAAPETRAPEASDSHSELRRLEQGLAAAKSRLEGRGDGRGESRTAAEAAPSSAPVPMSSGADVGAGRCEPVCQAAQEICGFSRRICQLAGQINDSDSTRSCQRAEKECQDASALCSGCR
jgi:hypothetical protein